MQESLVCDQLEQLIRLLWHAQQVWRGFIRRAATNLFLKYCTEVVIPKQHSKLIVSHGCIKLTEPMVSQLWGSALQELFCYQCWNNKTKLKSPLLLTSMHVIQQRCSEWKFLAVKGIPQKLMCNVNKGTMSNSMGSDVLVAVSMRIRGFWDVLTSHWVSTA